MRQTELSEKMIARADLDSLPGDHEMRTLALEFDNTCQGYFATPQTVSVSQFLGSWARARRVWCNYTGEDLI